MLKSKEAAANMSGSSEKCERLCFMGNGAMAVERGGSGFTAALVRDRSSCLLPPSVCLTVSLSVLLLLVGSRVQLDENSRREL